MTDANRTIAYMLKDVIDINMVAVCNDICSILNIEKVDGNSKYFMLPLIENHSEISDIIITCIKDKLVASSSGNTCEICDNDLDLYINSESLDIFVEIEHGDNYISIEKI
jgi:hypothetical protein